MTDLLAYTLIAFTIILVLQILYWLWLKRGSRRNTVQYQTVQPLMPTTSDSNIPTQYEHRSNYNNSGVSGKMIILSGLAKQEIELPGQEFGVGRFYNPESGVLVALNEKSISRKHAIFRSDPSRQYYTIMDSNSSYGTSIRKDNEFVILAPRQEERLYDGDVIRFGSTVTVQFSLSGDTRINATKV
ncbi:hypothetical protein MASR2M15_11510 [Anaerolineales bacterium]